MGLVLPQWPMHTLNLTPVLSHLPHAHPTLASKTGFSTQMDRLEEAQWLILASLFPSETVPFSLHGHCGCQGLLQGLASELLASWGGRTTCP